MDPKDLTCSDVRARAWALLDGELAADEAAAARRHLEACPACAAHLEAERGFLALLGRASAEEAPARLRARVATMLETAFESRQAGAPRRRWLPAVAVAAAAATLLLFLALPRERAGGPGGATALAAAFADDHDAHAERRPSIHPFPPGGEPPPSPPPLLGVELRGISRCVVAGHAYAHYTYAVAGGTVSLFVPIGSAPLPPAQRPAEADGVTVLAFAPQGGAPGVVLVSDDLGSQALASLRQGV